LEALILCRFDQSYGPKIFLKAPISLNEEDLKDIPSLMDLNAKGVFIHIFEQYKTANLLFDIYSEYARGKKENFLITIITDVNSNLKLLWAREMLESFAKDLSNIKDAYKAFDLSSRNYKGNVQKLEEIENRFFSFFNSIKPAIKTLELAEQRYQLLFRAARDAIFIINRDLGVIIDVNVAAERIIGHNRDEIIGLHPSQLKEIDLEILGQISSMQTKSPFILKTIKKSNNEIIFMEINATEILLGNQHLIQVILHDITDMKIAEQKIEDHAKNIEILNKIITLVNQAPDLSKLFKNILDSLMGYFKLDGCNIYLVDKFAKIAEIKIHKGFSADFIESHTFLKINEPPYDYIFINGLAIFNDNFPEITKKFLEGTEFKSVAIIPLFSKYEIVGSMVMTSRNQKLFSPQEIELLISIGLELGTAIIKMKNETHLKQSEVRHNILLSHIPFSILRLSDEGIVLDIKLTEKMEMIINQDVPPNNRIGRNISEILPEQDAAKLYNSITQALENKESTTMTLVELMKDGHIIFYLDIIPIENKEVLVFFKEETTV